MGKSDLWTWELWVNQCVLGTWLENCRMSGHTCQLVRKYAGWKPENVNSERWIPSTTLHYSIYCSGGDSAKRGVVFKVIRKQMKQLFGGNRYATEYVCWECRASSHYSVAIKVQGRYLRYNSVDHCGYFCRDLRVNFYRKFVKKSASSSLFYRDIISEDFHSWWKHP